LVECLASAVGREAAKIRAALAELWYCAASSNLQGATVFAPGSPGHTRFESIANLAGSAPPDVASEVTTFIWSVRLTYACLTHMERALGDLESCGEIETALTVQVLKDLGKVHSFAAQFMPRIFWISGLEQRQDHQAEATAKLKCALQLHTMPNPKPIATSRQQDHAG